LSAASGQPDLVREAGKQGRAALERQLRRQSTWLGDSFEWILRTRVLGQAAWDGSGTRALDVGCGPGFVLDGFRDHMDIIGLDADPDWILACRKKGVTVVRADATRLPFKDRALDLVYCSFLLLWLSDPAKAAEEMARVSREHVVCLAEPDYGSRIDHPDELSELRGLITSGLEAQGGSPEIGRRLRSILAGAGLSVEVGVHPGVWDIERLEAERDDELDFVRSVSPGMGRDKLARLKEAWSKAAANGSLFEYNAIFYAIGRRQ
jgi:SAM-dependent methyltransferase